MIFPKGIKHGTLSPPNLLRFGLRMFITTFLFMAKVHGHGVEVLHCLTTTGNLRIFIRHWHGNGITTTNAGAMVINDVVNSITSTLTPTGVIGNTAVSGLPGCSSPITQDSSCAGYLSYDDWVWYDFPTTCKVPVEYTLLQGTTVVLTDGCPNANPPLYPTTISATFTDTTPPQIFLNGSPCDATNGFSVQTRSCRDQQAKVFFRLSALDDCDPNPVITSSPPIGLFPIGTTTVTVSATDASENVSTCTFSVTVVNNCAPSATPSKFEDPKTTQPSSKPTPQKEECLGCTFMKGARRLLTTGQMKRCKIAMKTLQILGSSGSCTAQFGSDFPKERSERGVCRESPCSVRVNAQVILRNRISKFCGCTLVVSDNGEKKIAISPKPSKKFLTFSYSKKLKCTCETHKVNAKFSCKAKNGEEYCAIKQTAEYSCSECDLVPTLAG